MFKTTADYHSDLLSIDMDINLSRIKNELGNPDDLLININKVCNSEVLNYASIYIDNLIDKSSLSSMSSRLAEIIEARDKAEDPSPEDRFCMFRNSLCGLKKCEDGTSLNILCEALIEGKTVFIIDGCSSFLSIDTYSAEGRAVVEPSSQSLIRGPKEGFVENSSVNLAMIRKRIKNKSLRVNDLIIGSITHTKITLIYIDKLARQDIVDEMVRRLKAIEIDGILDSGYIEELIKDDRYSVFPTFLNSEKPDSVVAELLEGKVAILVDGSAFVLTAPALFIEFLQSSEDYYHQYIVSSMIRITRYVAFFLTLLVPAGYISLVTFHQEMIPTSLLISIASQREGVPFPALAEALIMEGIFEILREAGIRMPRIIGPAISIVGALVLGQAAVEAGIISAFVVIVVSITAISSFAIPNYSMANAIRLIRFILMILGGAMGLYGVFMGLNVLILHLCKLKSFGLPYMTPVAPKTNTRRKDTILRYPLWDNRFRPSGISSSESPRVVGDDPVTSKQRGKPEFRKKMNNRNYLLAFIIALSLFLCGCMGGRELNTLGIAIALGIDKVGNSYQVTYQILNPKALASQKNVSEAPFILYEETGEDLFEIIRRFTTLSPRKIYNSHLKLVVFGESFAKEGIREIIDFFTRDHEFRSDFFFAVSNGSTANNLLSTITPLETVPGMAIYNSIRTAESSWAPVKPIRTLELVNVLASDGINPVLTGLELLDRGNRTVSDAALQQINPTKVRLTGLAVFKKDKLVGWLTEEESKGYSYITGNVKDTVGHIQYDEKNRITFEVIKSEAKTIAYILEGNPAIKVEIDVKSNVAAETGFLDVSTEENAEKLNSFIEEQIASFCYASIKKTKEKLGTDIYGFGEELHRTYPDYWKEISQNWNKEFPELAVIVKVNSEINGLGQNTRSILFKGEN